MQEKRGTLRIWLQLFLPILLYLLFWRWMQLNGALSNTGFYLVCSFFTLLLCETLPQRVVSRPSRFDGKKLVAGLLLGIASVTMLLIVFLLLYGQPNRFLSVGAANGTQLLQNCLYYALLVAPTEEALFRRYFLYWFEQLCSSGKAAVLLQALLFGLWHWPGGHNLIQVFITTLLGLLYGFALKDESHFSFPSIVAAHGAHNIVLELVRYFC